RRPATPEIPGSNPGRRTKNNHGFSNRARDLVYHGYSNLLANEGSDTNIHDTDGLAIETRYFNARPPPRVTGNVAPTLHAVKVVRVSAAQS
ncbi:hypothetical protein, partial [Infirmifilum sp.]|uniref:hypothetical protein n=1 Tax=Infirmifilum sp. TaxID=2856575 RepID=UPI003D0E415C